MSRVLSLCDCSTNLPIITSKKASREEVSRIRSSHKVKGARLSGVVRKKRKGPVGKHVVAGKRPVRCYWERIGDVVELNQRWEVDSGEGGMGGSSFHRTPRKLRPSLNKNRKGHGKTALVPESKLVPGQGKYKK